MTTVVGIVGGWVLVNAALAAALLMRRDRPEARAKLMAWVLKGARRPNRMAPDQTAASFDPGGRSRLPPRLERRRN
jgi:hypothetical protein